MKLFFSRRISEQQKIFTILSILLLVFFAVFPAHSATFLVTKTSDTADGVCDTDCSLREAIISSNASVGVDIINLPAGNYRLTISGINENYADTGDLDITDNLKLIGSDASNTIIDGGRIDRVFDIRDNRGFGINVELSGITVKNGIASFGGGIQNNQKGLVKFTNSTITENEANTGGGVFNSSIATMELHRVTLSSNDASGPGGGGVANDGSLTLINSTVSGNVASSIITNGGSAISNFYDGISTLINTTIANNYVYTNATGGDGSINNSGTVNLVNSILWASSGVVCFGSGTYNSLGHNLASNDCELNKAGDISVNPSLGPLQDNGGPTMTHALLSNSNAINAGDNTACPETDQRSVQRDDSQCDIGAFEFIDPANSDPVDLSGTIKTPDGKDICAMVLASGQYIFSCNPIGMFSLLDLPRENNGTVKRQIYADGFFPKIDILADSTNDAVVMTRSGTCPSYNASYAPSVVPGSAGKRINISGKVLLQNSQTPICAMVLANGQYMFSCDGTGIYNLNIPLDNNGQYKLQVYADGFAPTIQTFDEFSAVNDVRMARAVECQ